MSSTATSTGTSTTGSSTALFPTVTASGLSSSISNQSPTTYYFVFLGVLVVLLLIAASLAYRALRIRRRFRTAAQLAVMRGEAPPRMMSDNYWGMGAFAGWHSDQDRDYAEQWLTRRFGDISGKWEKVPNLVDKEVVMDSGAAEMEETLPVTLHSLLPPDPQQHDFSQFLQNRVPPQMMGPRARPPPEYDFHQIRAMLIRAGRADLASTVQPPSSSASSRGHRSTSQGNVNRQEIVKEIDREIKPGEDVRIAVIVRMPRDPDLIEEEKEMFEDDERPGWDGGMELGVWEGTVGR